MTSTKPKGKAIALTVSSLMSVATFDAFFGHETQIDASGLSFIIVFFRVTVRDSLDFEKIWTTSTAGDKEEWNLTPAGNGASIFW